MIKLTMEILSKYETEIVDDGTGEPWIKIEETDELFRVRMIDPDKFDDDSFRIVDIGDEDDGIRAVMGKLSGEDTMTLQSYLFDKDKFTLSEVKEWVRSHEESNNEGGDDVSKTEKESRKIVGYMFDKNDFKDLISIKAWAEINSAVHGLPKESGDNFFYGPGDLTSDNSEQGLDKGGVTVLYAKPMADNPPDPEMPDLYGIEGVEIFKEGVWTDCYGTTFEVEEKHIKALKKNSGKGRNIPISLGHWAFGHEPAKGLVENLQIKGKSLVGDFTHIPKDVYGDMKAMAFPSRSAEIIWDDKKSELVGLALLGSAQSALPLENIKFSKHEKKVCAYQYMAEDFKTISKKDGGETSMDEKLIAKFEAEIKALKEKIAALEAEKSEEATRFETENSESMSQYEVDMKAAENTNDTLTKEVEELKTSLTKKEELIGNHEKERKEADTVLFKSQITDKVIPAEIDSVIQTFEILRDSGDSEKFEAYKKAILERKDHEGLGETGDEKADDKPGDGEDVELHEKANEWLEERKMEKTSGNYSIALKAVEYKFEFDKSLANEDE